MVQVGVLSWYEWSKLDIEGRELHLASLITSLTAEADEQLAELDSGVGSFLDDDDDAASRMSGARGVAISRGHMRASPPMQQTPPL